MKPKSSPIKISNLTVEKKKSGIKMAKGNTKKTKPCSVAAEPEMG